MGRVHASSINQVSLELFQELKSLDLPLKPPILRGLSDLVCCSLFTRCVNTAEWATVLPRDCKDDENRQRYIRRLFNHPSLDPIRVISPFVRDLVSRSMKETLFLSMDQSKVCDGFEVLMISLCIGDRSIPLLWRVVQTAGEIGKNIYIPLLEKLAPLLEGHPDILFTADRFYGTSALIEWCQLQGWKYRIRLKSNLILHHQGGEIKTGEIRQCGRYGIEQATFHQTNVKSNIGFLQEEGKEESWIIAMDCKPTRASILDYGRRWAIEPMFSDFKSRGFRMNQTKLKTERRIEVLILILTIATYWAVSTGANIRPPGYFSKKNSTDQLYPHLKRA